MDASIQRVETTKKLTVYVGYNREVRKRWYVSETAHGTKRDPACALAKFFTEVAEAGRVAECSSFG